MDCYLLLILFVTVGDLGESTSQTTCMWLGPGINTAMQRANQPEIKHSQLSYRLIAIAGPPLMMSK